MRDRSAAARRCACFLFIPDVPNSTAETQADGDTFSVRRLSGRRKYSLFMMALATMFSGCGFSIIAPFYPAEVSLKELPPKAQSQGNF